ncbi:oocyte zinc finger protein XlCOF6-like [Cydia strobilella]|uniref:oocyte zinc finger protein XlCOF6-like n=1 Tax=Cydia strobilella TaxID=1100964 RepID=UPI0030074221
MLKSLKQESAEELLACRICLATDTHLYGILEHRLENAFIDITGTTLSAWDGYPQHICVPCRALLRRASDLRARCRRAQRALKRILMLQHTITTGYIRTVDRIAEGLSLPLSISVCPEPVLFQYDDTDDLIKEEIPLLSPSPLPSLPSPPKDDIVVKDELPCEYESNDDVALSELQEKPKEHKEKRKKVLRKSKTKKTKTEQVKSRERKKTEKIRDEDFPAFEKEYNFDVVILSREQQIEDMASRKEKDNYMNSQFKCEKCFKGFYTEATLANHDSKHHDEAVGPHSCELCLCRFRIPAILRRHLATHRLRFVCQHCGFTARDRSHAMTHSKEHKGLRYECQHCGDTFKKRSTYGTHVRIQHPNQNKSCDVCGETFLGALGLALHKKKSHRQVVEQGAAHCAQCGVCFESEYARARHTALAVQGCQHARACALCGENFKDEPALQAHVRERHQDRQTQCQECDMTFASEASRSVHYERVHLKVKVRRCLPKTGRKYDRYGDHFMCEMCGKKCQNNIALKYHIRSHTGEKPHACPHCPKHYSTPVALQYHIRSHTGDKPLACPHCPLRYATHKGLQTHLLKHTGERPFKCELCGKAFTQKTMLQKHKTVHTGEKPYACDICGKAFTQSGSVHTHVKYVHKKLPAPPRNRGKRDKPD